MRSASGAGRSASGRVMFGPVSRFCRRQGVYFQVLVAARPRWLGFGPRGTRAAAPLIVAAALAACTAPLSTVALRQLQQDSRIPVVAPTPAQDRLVAINPYESLPPIVAEGEERETAAVESTPSLTPSPAPAQRTAPPRPVRTVFDPDQLLGMGRDQVVAVLGMPNLLRRDPPAELWLYEGQACTAHLFLYQSSPDGDYQVRYVETQAGQQPAAANAGDCFAGLVTSGNGGQFGQLR
ncbi:MAG: hypothetical protein IID55_09605 [Proteobacteria bacterium]|nr:hypothetical protein [Pseudomonadota bacterium]